MCQAANLNLLLVKKPSIEEHVTRFYPSGSTLCLERVTNLLRFVDLKRLFFYELCAKGLKSQSSLSG